MNTVALKKYQGIVLFVLLFLFSLGVQFSFPDLAGVDGYYHIGMADQLRQVGVFSNDGYFPYLQFTSLKEAFANQHFLYHVLLIPFTYFDLILGAKLAASLFAALAYFSFFVLGRVLKVRYIFFFSLLLPLISEGFLFRMTLPRAPAPALAATLFLLALFFKNVLDIEYKKIFRLLLFLGSFFIVWLYGGFVLYAVLITAILFSFILYSGLKFSTFSIRPVLLAFGLSALGMVLGFVLHPYFPNILTYLRIQLFETGSFAQVAVGTEWKPYSFMSFLANTYIASIVYVVALCVLLLNAVMYWWKKRSGKVFYTYINFTDALSGHDKAVLFSVLVCSVVAAVLQVTARRYVEYFVPFSYLLVSMVLSHFFFRMRSGIGDLNGVKGVLLHWQKLAVAFACIVWIVLSGGANAYFVYRDANDHVHRRPIADIQEVSRFTRENIPAGEIIFNVAWDDFPMLFMGDRSHYYAWGLDPTFMYRYSPELYEKSKIVWSVQNPTEIASVLKNDFKVRYVYVDFKDKKLRTVMKGRDEFQVLFDNDAGTVFEVL